MNTNVDYGIKNKTAVVTGGAQGIGREIAIAFLKVGTNVVAADINEEVLEKFSKEIESFGFSGSLEIVKADVSSVSDLEKMINASIEKFGSVDILINNAGILHSTPVEEITESEWDKIMAINLKGMFFAAQKAIPHMKKNNWGRIINISSLAGRMGGYANGLAYSASKAGIIKKYKPVVICALDVQHNLVKYHGIEIEEKGVSVRPVESHHWSFAKAPDGTLLSGPAMGYIFDIGDGRKYYHPGDTALFSDMKLIGEINKPTVGFMHVSLPTDEGVGMPHGDVYKCGEITLAEALLASEWLGLDEVITSHYVDPECDDVKEFVQLVEKNREEGKYAPKVIVIKPGDTFKFEEKEKVSTLGE